MAKGQGCGCCRVISSFITMLMIAAGAYAAWFFLGKPSGEEILDILQDIDFSDLTGALENFTGFTPDLWDEDPFVGNNSTNLWQGHTKGKGGLSLELWNALDESWQGEYIEAVADWNNWCGIKVLDLSSKDVEVDNACEQADGVMKVCNGNYGETGWLGINEVLKSVPGGIIQSSVAKMNEHYLLNADYDERLYTMCHELGHGYGLPHTDENFNNKDQGNCLDYTNNPANNLRPGVANCNRLLEMYGSVDGTISGNNTRTRRRKLSQQAAERALRHRSDIELYEDFEDEDDDEADYEDDVLEDDAQYYYDYARSEYPNMSTEYEEAMKDFYYEFPQGSLKPHSSEDFEEDAWFGVREAREEGNWRRLREHPRGGDFVRKLNEGFVLEVHVLYPNNNN